MIASIILSFVITSVALRLIKKPINKKEDRAFYKISDRVFMTPNGVVDFDEKPQLSVSQEMSNRRLDFEIMMANKHNDFVNKKNRLKIEAWETACKEHPDKFVPFPDIDMSMPKRVFGIRYVV